MIASKRMNMKKEEWKKARFKTYSDKDLIEELSKRGYIVLKTSK
jgi:hypothetical protein